MTTSTTTSEHWIDGQPVTGSGNRIEVVNPATEQVIATVPEGTAADVDAAVAAAKTAFPAWGATDPAERAALVGKIVEGLQTRSDELAATITAEMGAPITFSNTIQVGLPLMAAQGFLKAAAEFPWSEEIGNSLVLREPIGVVGAITPWNYPLHQIVAKTVPALLAGCTVVAKPTEIAPLAANILAEVIAAAGAPAGVFNIVHGYGPVVGEAIAAHPDVDMVSFTGSTRAGRRVAEVGSQTVKRVALELGGKSASVVLDDADLGAAVKRGIANCYINGGQTCTALTRMLVPAAKLDEIVELAVQRAGTYTVGDPTDEKTRIGPMSSAAQQERVLGYLRTGASEADVAFGGPDADTGMDKGAFVAPTIFSGVTPDMTIAQEEIFGPALAIMPYTDDDNAVEIANSTIYGLSGAVFSADRDRAIAFAKRMRTGQVDINDGRFNPTAPFGGYRQSGNGRELGRFGIEEFTEVKSLQL